MIRWLLPPLTALPWLTPFAPAPSTYGVPWLVTLWCIVTMWATLGLLRASREVWIAAWARGLVLAGLVSAVIGLAQYNGLAAHWSELTQGWVNAGSPGVAYGHLRQRNLFATLMNISLAASTFLLWQHPRPLRQGSWLMWSVCAILFISANVASASRTGLIQLLAMALLGLAFAAIGRAPRLLAMLSALSLGIGAVALWAVPRLLGPADVLTALDRMNEAHACENRMVMWLNVMELISQRPWFGWGLGELDWAHHMAEYKWTALGGPHRFCFLLDNAHNLFLQIAVEAGLLACLVLGVAGLMLLALRKPWSEQRPHVLLAWTVVLLVLFHSMLEYPLWYGPFVMVTATSLWLILQPTCRIPAQAVRSRACAAALVGAVLSSWVTFEYLRVSQYFLPREQRLAWIDTPALSHAKPSLLFQSQLDFARLITMNIERDNAAEALVLAQNVMHYSPEPRVIEQLLLAAMWEDDQAAIGLHEARYRQAYPDAYRQWLLRRVLIQSVIAARR